MKEKMHFTIMGLIAFLALALTLTGCAKNTSEKADSTEEGANVSTSTESQQTAASNDNQGAYHYVVSGHDFALRTRLEDYISDGEVDILAIGKTLGYSETGILYDDDENPIALVGASKDEGLPCTTIIVRTNIEGGIQGTKIPKTILIRDTNPSSQLLDDANLINATYSFDQLVVATYLWEICSDGKDHDDPLINIFEDEGSGQELHIHDIHKVIVQNTTKPGSETASAENTADGQNSKKEVWHLFRSVQVKDGHPTSAGQRYDWNDDFTYCCRYSGDEVASESYYENGLLVRSVSKSKSVIGYSTSFSSDDIRYDEQKYTYDDQERVTLIEYYYNGELVATEENIWEADGSHMGYLYAVSENNEVSIEYEYDSSDRMIRKTMLLYGSEERYEYETDSQDRILKKETHLTVSGEDRIIFIDEYEYNEDGTVKTLIESENYFLEDRYTSWQTDYDYDEYGNRIHYLKHYISDIDIGNTDDKEYFRQYISESGLLSGEIPE